jgi:hypothetical protein
MRALLLAITLAWPAVATAQPHSARECREGSDFIRNAALARDAGYTREFFVGRLEEDFVMIRAFPPELRWFVRDPGDEEFLRSEVEAVFADPASSEQHRAGFLQRCTLRAEREKRPDA